MGTAAAAAKLCQPCVFSHATWFVVGLGLGLGSGLVMPAMRREPCDLVSSRVRVGTGVGVGVGVGVRIGVRVRLMVRVS